MALEDTLFQYGILGLWTIWLLYRENLYTTKIENLISNNTIALTKCADAMSTCPLKNQK